MKRLIAVVAALCSSAVYANPFEQSQMDRVLPDLPGTTYANVSYPSEESTVRSPWTGDHHFIAPAQ